MSDSMRMWMEIGFNIAYLAVVWALIIAMIRGRANVAPENQKLAKLFTLAFVLLATGDVGHVGFRVIAYATGDLTASGGESTLVGLGALATAITVTFFYMVMVYIWSERFKAPRSWVAYALLAVGLVRLVIMAFPQNQWNLVVPPQPWSLIRNIPLMVQGIGVMLLILRDATISRDRLFQWIGLCIALSYIFYTPVILFVQTMPMLGMLMIPKTLAYVAIAFLAYNGLWRGKFAEKKQPALGFSEAD